MARHSAFITPRLVGGCAALALLPLCLAIRGAPSVVEMAVFGWIATSMVAAYVLSRTGRFDLAQILSAAALCAFVVMIAWRTGGLHSFAVLWLAAVPFEAALGGSRRTIAVVAGLATLVAAILLIAAPQASPADFTDGLTTFVALVSAAVYGVALAYNAQALTRKGAGLLHAEEDRYRLLARHMTDMITRHGPNGVVSFVSPAAENLFETECSALLGQGLFDRVHVADRPAYRTAIADASRGDTRSLEFRVRKGNDPARFVWVEMRCHPLEPTLPKGESSEVVAVLRDIGERKCHEEALIDARAEAESANAGKGRFLATMSHELRTPLNAIIGFSEMLGNDELPQSAERRREYAHLINDSGRHLLSVVNGILDMSKMESGNFEITPEPFSPGPVVSGCCQILKLKAQQSGVSLDVAVSDDLPDLVADRRAVSQVVLNLVSNAIKFSDRGGHVGVRVVRDGGCIVFSVKDTGVGIDESDLPRLGEAFFQARASYDRRHDGTGLGLSIVKGLVRLHGGATEIESRLGEGTCVTVRLPLDCEGRHLGAQPIPLAAKVSERSRALVEEQVRKSA